MNGEPVTRSAVVTEGSAGNEKWQVKAKLTAKTTAKIAGRTARWRTGPAARIPFLAALICFLGAAPGLTQVKTRPVPLDALNDLKPRNVKTEVVTYKGHQALRVTDAAPADSGDAERLVILSKTEFKDGVIEIDLTGEPGPSAVEGARGFAGVAFRIAPDASKYECFYLRPTNGRADDQVRRNHSVQYISFPGFPWQRLRKEFPEKYESYVDLVPGEWTKVKIEVRGDRARLYVHGAQQPTLLVNDLKQGQSQGGIALWVGPGTVAHFSNLRVSE
jgi:hypothetical protein